jgi:hypothetical protein
VKTIRRDVRFLDSGTLVFGEYRQRPEGVTKDVRLVLHGSLLGMAVKLLTTVTG